MWLKLAKLNLNLDWYSRSTAVLNFNILTQVNINIKWSNTKIKKKIINKDNKWNEI